MPSIAASSATLSSILDNTSQTVACTMREDIIVCEENSQVHPWAMASVHTTRGRDKRSIDFGLRKEYCGHASLLLSMLSMMIESTEREVWLGAEHCDRYCLANQSQVPTELPVMVLLRKGAPSNSLPRPASMARH